MIVTGYVVGFLDQVNVNGDSGTVWAVSQAISQVHNVMTAHGTDGVIPLIDNSFGIGGRGLGLRWANANNHQLTYGVLESALEALRSWMIFFGACGVIEYNIFDGGNQIATGSCSWRGFPG